MGSSRRDNRRAVWVDGTKRRMGGEDPPCEGKRMASARLLPETLFKDDFRGHRRIQTAENGSTGVLSSGHGKATLSSLVGRPEHADLPVAGSQ